MTGSPADLVRLNSSYNFVAAPTVYPSTGETALITLLWPRDDGRLGIDGSLSFEPPEIDPGVVTVQVSAAGWVSNTPTITPCDNLAQTDELPVEIDWALGVDEFGPGDTDMCFGAYQDSGLWIAPPCECGLRHLLLTRSLYSGMRRSFSNLSLLCLALLALCACGQSSPRIEARQDSIFGGQDAPAGRSDPARTAQPGVPGLPGPAELLTQLGSQALTGRKASYLPADLQRAAEDYEISLPRSNVAAAATGLAFQPVNNSPDGISGRAYAIYSFQIPGYEGDAAVTPVFNTAPLLAGEVFIALANWGEQRWDWFAPGVDGTARPASLDPYTLFNGTLLCCMLQTGINGSELDSLRIGSLPPQPSLTATPKYGRPPVSVSFDASASTDLDGTIKQYKWDPEGDGTFGTSTGTDPHLSFDYGAEGTYNPGVRVYDDSGVYVDLRIEIKVVASALHSYGGSDDAEVAYQAVALPDGDLVLVGYKGSLFSDQWAHFARVSPDGSAGFARSWEQDFSSILFDAKLLGGHIYACGQDQTNDIGQTDYDGLVQKWDLEGNLIWSRRIGPPGERIFLRALAAAYDRIYVVGEDDNGGYGLVVCMDLDGNVVWSRIVTGPQWLSLYDIVYTDTIQIGGTALRTCGDYRDANGDTLALYCGFDHQGAITGALGLGGAGDNNVAHQIDATSGPNTPKTFISGSLYNGGNSTRFVSRLGGPVTTYIPEASQTLDTCGLLVLGSNVHLLMRSTVGPGADSGAPILVTLDSGLTQLSAFTLLEAGSGEADPYGLTRYGSASFVICGGIDGLLPQSSAPALTSGTSALTWTAVTPIAAPPAVLENLQTSNAVEINEDLAFDRQELDTDSYFGIFP